MVKLIALVGPAGSGKSTFASEYVKKNPNTYIVSRDSERSSLFGEYRQGSPVEENMITHIVENKVKYLLNEGVSVILDNCHVRMGYIQTILSSFNKIADVEYKFMDNIPLDQLYARNERREKLTGKYIPQVIIKSQWEQFNKLIGEFEQQEYPKYFPKTKI